MGETRRKIHYYIPNRAGIALCGRWVGGYKSDITGGLRDITCKSCLIRINKKQSPTNNYEQTNVKEFCYGPNNESIPDGSVCTECGLPKPPLR